MCTVYLRLNYLREGGKRVEHGGCKVKGSIYLSIGGVEHDEEESTLSCMSPGAYRLAGRKGGDVT